jgi:hypothetical protein
MGRDVHRYESLITERVVIFPYQIINNKAIIMDADYISSNFPLGWAYLQRVKTALENRENGRMKTRNYFAYIYPKSLAEFNQVKILSPDLCARPEMTIDLDGSMYHTTTIHSIVLKNKSLEYTYYMLGVLNSQVLRFHMTVAGNEQRGGYHRYTPGYLNPFPIPESTPAQQEMIATFVQYVLALKREDTETKKSSLFTIILAYFENIIEALVYELYFPEEFTESVHVALIESRDILVAPDTLTSTPTAQLEALYRALSHRNHRVNRIIYYMDTIPTIRVLLGKE